MSQFIAMIVVVVMIEPPGAFGLVTRHKRERAALSFQTPTATSVHKRATLARVGPFGKLLTCRNQQFTPNIV